MSSPSPARNATAAWRAAHEDFFRGEGVRGYLGRTPAFDDDTLVVAERFRVVEA